MEIEMLGKEMEGGERKVGEMEEDNGGIIYMEEVEDMKREKKKKILRVMVDKKFESVGGKKRVKVDVRII